MNKNKITKFLQSVVAIPMLAVATPMVGVSPIPAPAVVLNQDVVSEASPITTESAKDIKERAEKIDALLAKYNSPLVGYGEKFVKAADENGIDYRLVVAIAGQESTFARHACKKVKNSFLGYNGCNRSFKSVDEAIEVVSASLGGNDENTDHHYAGKTTTEKLKKYNSVNPNYTKKVITIMKMIDDSQEIV